MSILFSALLAIVIVLSEVSGAVAGDREEAVQIGWLSQATKRSLPLSYLDQPPEDEGVQGARLGIADNNTTGRFTGQSFALTETIVPEEGDLAAGFRQLAAKGVRLVVTDLAAPQLLSVAGMPETQGVTFFNTGAASQQFLVESVVGIQTVKAAAVEPQMRSEWDERLATYVQTSFDVSRLGALGQGAVQAVSRLSTASILFFGAKAVMIGRATFCNRIADPAAVDLRQSVPSEPGAGGECWAESNHHTTY